MTSYFRAGQRIEPARLEDAEALAELHGLAFHRGWDAAEIEALLSRPEVLALGAWRIGHFTAPSLAGFLLTRAAADEAEVLTLVIHPARRRLGFGRMLMEEGLRRLYASGTRSVFLEVESGNEPAVGLYRRLGFRRVGSRPGYYMRAEGPAEALVLRLDLG